MLLSRTKFLEPLPQASVTDRRVRFRTIPQTNNTVAAGMIRGEEEKTLEALSPHLDQEEATMRVSPDVVCQGWNMTAAELEARNGHKALVVWSADCRDPASRLSTPVEKVPVVAVENVPPSWG